MPIYTYVCGMYVCVWECVCGRPCLYTLPRSQGAHNIKITVMCILSADYCINSNTNLLVRCSIMSMTWLCSLQGIGVSHCNTLQPHGRDWKREVLGCENHVREVVERDKNRKRECEKKGDKVSCFLLSEAQLLQLSLFKCCSMTLN